MKVVDGRPDAYHGKHIQLISGTLKNDGKRLCGEDFGLAGWTSMPYCQNKNGMV